ncbi:MAG: hypothetical protein LBC95_01980 [Candidatus Nomurabacteria bacterium]|jgi:hypothetical protein|nr:hypothetical protein [Candidatus Nomurabacteria bacterium]
MRKQFSKNKLKGSVFVAICLIFIGIITFLTSVQKSHAADTDLTLNLNSALSMSVTNCPGLPDPDNSSITLDAGIPSSSGTFRSNCQTVEVDTNAPGYTLTTKASSSDLTHTTIVTPPVPFIPSTATSLPSKSTLTSNHWGFAVENHLGFDVAYATNNAGNNFAKMPTTDTTVYATTVMPTAPDQFNFYYGVNVDSTQAAGRYSTTVTYTAISEPVPPPVWSCPNSDGRCVAHQDAGTILNNNSAVTYSSSGTFVCSTLIDGFYPLITPDGKFYIFGGGRGLRQVDYNSNVCGSVITGTGASWFIADYLQGNKIYSVTPNAAGINIIDTTNNSVSTISTPTLPNVSPQMILMPSGLLYILFPNNSTHYVMDTANGNSVSTISLPLANFSAVRDFDGRIWVFRASSGTHRIIESDGSITSFTGWTSPASFNPTLTTNGKIYMIVPSSSAVSVISTVDGVVSTISLPTALGSWANPALMPNGKLYIVNTGAKYPVINLTDDSVYEINKITNDNHRCISYYPNGKLTVGIYSGGSIKALDILSDTVSDMSRPTNSNYCEGDILLPNGKVYNVADSSNTVRIYVPSTTLNISPNTLMYYMRGQFSQFRLSN